MADRDTPRGQHVRHHRIGISARFQRPDVIGQQRDDRDGAHVGFPRGKFGERLPQLPELFKTVSGHGGRLRYG